MGGMKHFQNFNQKMWKAEYFGGPGHSKRAIVKYAFEKKLS
jgi:hypothetical protein